MTDRVMVDIETLGRSPGAAILSVACVEFEPGEGLGRELERSITLQSCQDHGLTVDADTLEWWLDRPSETRQVLRGGDPLGGVLRDMSEWWPRSADEIWSKSPAFDVVLLAEAYDRLDRDPPWRFWQTRDVRTVFGLVDEPPAVQEVGPDHDAMADAKQQALQVAHILDRVEVGGDD